MRLLKTVLVVLAIAAAVAVASRLFVERPAPAEDEPIAYAQWIEAGNLAQAPGAELGL